MRISDWSTDVCSSDLAASDRAAAAVRLYGGHRGGWRTVGGGVPAVPAGLCPDGGTAGARRARRMTAAIVVALPTDAAVDYGGGVTDRSEEHTSELQSLMRISYAVFCLKKNITIVKDTSAKSHYINNSMTIHITLS